MAQSKGGFNNRDDANHCVRTKKYLFLGPLYHCALTQIYNWGRREGRVLTMISGWMATLIQGLNPANSHSSVMDLLKHCCYFLFSAFLLTSPTQYWTMKAARKHESRIIHSSINVTTQPQPICYVVLWIIRAGFLGKRKTLTHYKRLSLT